MVISVTITQPGSALSASISAQTNVRCFGNTTGSATASPAGGTPGYTYSWSTVPAQNTAELIAWLKAQPRPVDYASAGNGTLNHLFAEMFKVATGIDMIHVPYKAAAASVTDVVSGQIPITFASLPAATPFVKSGKLRILGVAAPTRTALLPDVPPIGDTVKGFGAVSWYGLLAPGGTPREIVAKLAGEVARAVANPAVRERLNAGGGEPASTTPAEFAALIRDELPRWERLVRASGARVD